MFKLTISRLFILDAEFDSFHLGDGESFENMYDRFIQIRDEYADIGEPLTNGRLVRKLLLVMVGRPQWENLVTMLKARYENGDISTPKDVYIHVQCHEKNLKFYDLEAKFESFSIGDGESIKGMYNRLLQIRDEFVDLGDPLTNCMLSRKLLQAMVGKPQWESVVTELEVMCETGVISSPKDVYTRLRCHEKKLKQISKSS